MSGFRGIDRDLPVTFDNVPWTTMTIIQNYVTASLVSFALGEE